MERTDGTLPKCKARILRKRKLGSKDTKESKIQKLDARSTKTPPKTPLHPSSPSSSSQESISWPSFTGWSDKRLIRFNNPLPSLSWTDSFGMWRSMVARELEGAYKRQEELFERNPCVHRRMRAVLLDWLNEVCEVYKMQRKCLYMSIDYVDRYLSRVSGVQKKSLQLIGVAALFIASKSEEIYPPNLSEFSFITDGACSTQDILTQELDILQVLTWRLSPVTPVCWVGLLLQVLSSATDLLSIQFDQPLFIKICRLVDLGMLSSSSLGFSYFTIAVAAISFFVLHHHALSSIIALSSDHRACREWMGGCHKVLCTDHSSIVVSHFPSVPDHSSHNIQTHLVSLEQLDAVQSIKTLKTCNKQVTTVSPSSPRKGPQNSTKNPLTSSSNLPEVLTPPKSIELKPKSGQSLVGVVDPEVLSVKYMDLNSP